MQLIISVANQTFQVPKYFHAFCFSYCLKLMFFNLLFVCLVVVVVVVAVKEWGLGVSGKLSANDKLASKARKDCSNTRKE
jgi:hypothetical protein